MTRGSDGEGLWSAIPAGDRASLPPLDRCGLGDRETERNERDPKRAALVSWEPRAIQAAVFTSSFTGTSTPAIRRMWIS